MQTNDHNTRSDPSLSSGPGNTRVLIVEDEEGARQATQRFLEFCGHDVQAANDPKSAVLLAASMQPHVVICDCNLIGKHDGIELARAIQQRSHVAIVFVSAYSRSSVKDLIQGILISGWLRKPISLKELESVVASAGNAIQAAST